MGGSPVGLWHTSRVGRFSLESCLLWSSLHPLLFSHCSSTPGPRWSSRLRFSFILIWSISSLGQDKLELELMLKGSYEDTQTFLPDTAFTLSFHYMRSQDTELNGYLRVSLCSHHPQLAACPFPCQGQAPCAHGASAGPGDDNSVNCLVL